MTDTEQVPIVRVPMRRRLLRPAGFVPKTISDLNGLWKFINDDDTTKSDFLVKGEQIEFTSRKTIAIPVGGGRTEEFAFSTWSFRQFARTLKIPNNYLSSCPIVGRGGMKDQIEMRMEHKKSNDFLIRVRRQGESIEGVSGVMRAFLPGNYTPFDNRHLLQSVTRAMRELSSTYDMEATNVVDPKSLDHGMHLRFLNRQTFAVATEEEVHAMGFHCSTSEIGSFEITVAGLIMRMICSNGMMGWGADTETLRLRHRDFQLHEVYPQIHEGILSTQRQEGPIRELLERTMEQVVTNPDDRIFVWGKQMRFSEEMIKAALDLFHADHPEQATKFSIMQAFTAAARTLPIHERVEAEITIGGFFSGAKVKRGTPTSHEDD